MGRLIIYGILAFFAGYGGCDKVCKQVGALTYSCDDSLDCCNDGTECCSEYWTTWRIIVIATAGTVALGLLIALVIVGVYHGCKKNTKADNNVRPIPLQAVGAPPYQPNVAGGGPPYQPYAGGSSYDQPPPPYEYHAETNFQKHPAPKLPDKHPKQANE